MDTHTVNTKWDENLTFQSQIGDHLLTMDAVGEMGNNRGPSPKKVMLASLAGCTGIDVASLLKKMRVNATGFEIDISADLTDEHPRVYSEIRMTYVFYGENLDRNKVEKAVKLSKERYCGISAMLAKNSPIHYDIEYR